MISPQITQYCDFWPKFVTGSLKLTAGPEYDDDELDLLELKRMKNRVESTVLVASQLEFTIWLENNQSQTDLRLK